MTSKEQMTAYIDSELEEIIPLFFDNTREDILSLREAFETGDRDALRRLGHSIKGSSLGYGFQELGELGRAIETAAAEDRNPEEIRGLIDALTAYVDNVHVVYK